MINPLLAKLKQNDKKGLWNSSPASISYETGFDCFDYRTGCIVDVQGENGKIECSYPSLGILGGTMNEFIAEAGVGKTTLALQIAANIARKFISSMIILYDMERSTTPSRLSSVTNFTKEEFEQKIVHKQEDCYVEDIIEMIAGIANLKRENRKDFEYDTGRKDDFGRPIISLEPTIVIIDSIPLLASKNSKLEEIEGQTLGGRVALLLSQFFNKILPMMKAANIIVFAINHLKEKPQMGGFGTKSPLMYLSNTKSVPGGKSQFYLSHNIFMLDKLETITEKDEAGFLGFKSKLFLVKSRQNDPGTSIDMIFENQTGYNNLLSLFNFAKDKGLITGRNPKSRLIGDPNEFAFDTRKMVSYLDNEDLVNSMKLATKPLLEELLSNKTPEELSKDPQDEVNEELKRRYVMEQQEIMRRYVMG